MTADDTNRRVANAVRTVLDAHAYVLDGVCACGRDLGAKHGQYRAALRAHTTEEIARALPDAGLLAPSARPTRWWRVIGADNQLWAETSNEVEARSRMRPGDTLYRLWEAMPASHHQRWLPVDRAAGAGSADQ
ncbi:hypothetical protein [Dietzia maris]|uniref:hypothetical protein n=1 Tax=Dietzia maris TaxID=37915 RepID=UPI0037C8D509